MIFDIKRNIPAISIMCAEPDSNAEIKTQQRLYQPIRRRALRWDGGAICSPDERKGPGAGDG